MSILKGIGITPEVPDVDISSLDAVDVDIISEEGKQQGGNKSKDEEKSKANSASCSDPADEVLKLPVKSLTNPSSKEIEIEIAR